MCAAMPRIEAVVVTPVPPMPVKMMFFTPVNASITGSGVESAVSAGSAVAWAFSPPSMVTNDGQKPFRHE